MESKYKIVITGDYFSECSYDGIEDLYCPQKPVEDVPILKYSKLLNLVISGILVLKKHDDDFVIVKEDTPQLAATQTTKKELLGRPFGKVFPIYEKLGFVDMLNEVDEKDKVFKLRAVTTFNDKITQIYNHMVFKDEDYFFISSEDIKSTEILKETEERVFNNPTIGICDLDIPNQYIHINDAFSNFIGYSEEELNQLELGDLIVDYNNFDPKIASFEDLIYKYTNNEILSSHEEVKVRKKDGTYGWLKLDSNITDFDEMIVRFTGINITNIKEAENRAFKLINSLNYIGDISKIAIIVNDGINFNYTAEFLEIFDLKESDDYSGDIFYDYIIEEDRDVFIDNCNNLTYDNPQFKQVVQIKTPLNKVKYIKFYVKNIFNKSINKDISLSFGGTDFKKEKGFVTSIYCIQDITESAENEIQLKDLADEREILLKEIHHRVKNNLQLILSFLNLERHFNKDNPEESLLNIGSRIQNIALTHEKTYSAPDLVNINIKDYVSTGIRNLLNLYNMEDITPVIDIDPNLHYSTKSFTTIGLILNEIYINALKYAFKDNQEYKEIYISIKEENEDIVIIVKDNGVGLPESMDIHNSPSLGLTIINQLTEQLDGTFEKIDAIGTAYKFTFSKEIF